MSASFNCGICLEAVPVSTVLPCGHDFCNGCLEEWTKRGANGSVSCPKCRREVKIESLPLLQRKFHGLLPCAVCETPKPGFRLQFCRECGTHQCSDCAWDPCHTAKNTHGTSITPFHHLEGVARLKRSLKRGVEAENAAVDVKIARITDSLGKKLRSRLHPDQPIQQLLSNLNKAFGPLDEAPESRFDDAAASEKAGQLLGLMGVETPNAGKESLDSPERQADVCIDALLAVWGMVKSGRRAAVPFSPLHRGLFVAKPSEVDEKGVPDRIYKVVGATRLRVYGALGRPLSYRDTGEEATFEGGIERLHACPQVRYAKHTDLSGKCVDLLRAFPKDGKIPAWE